ncbi:MAG TPA: hypothetical protein VFI93_13200 [Rhizomicrobium sp.]|nr:hypothetical protein [Rhizomicrobium sp.]
MAVLAAFFAASQAAAATATPADLYVAGQYQAAIDAGSAQDNAQGYAIAARAALAIAMLHETPCLECLQRAESLARASIAKDPKRADARVYLAAALGYQGRIIGMIQTRFKGYPSEAKSNLDAALAAEPNDARALAALGGWNIAIVTGGGAMLANMLYGATLEKGLADFNAAFKRAPADIVLRYQYALSLSAYDRKKYRKNILDALTYATNGNAASAYEQAMQKRAATLLALLKSGDTEKYDTMVKRFQGYP